MKHHYLEVYAQIFTDFLSPSLWSMKASHLCPVLAEDPEAKKSRDMTVMCRCFCSPAPQSGRGASLDRGHGRGYGRGAAQATRWRVDESLSDGGTSGSDSDMPAAPLSPAPAPKGQKRLSASPVYNTRFVKHSRH